MYQVTLTRGNLKQVYGTYSTLAEAEQIADTHRNAGYWTVVVEAV